LVTLDLDHHLLQPEDNLFTALLRHLGLEVVVCAIPVLFRVLLVVVKLLLLLVARIRLNLVLETRETSLRAALSIVARVSTLLCVISGRLGGPLRVALAGWVSLLRGIAGGVLQILLANGHSGLNLLPEGVPREIRLIMPGVVGRSFVELLELLVRRVDSVRGLLSGVARNVA